MGILKQSDVISYVENNIGVFHQKRLGSLTNLKLITIIRKKNPYLYKAKYILTADEVVKGILGAHLSSNEETIFGDWLEGLAIFINQNVFGGWKSGIPGIDLEFDLEKTRYIVNIKSGPNWGNSTQIRKMISDFNAARKTLRTSNSNLNVVAVNGCCYGRDSRPDKKGVYFKYCGQRFWEFISGDPELYKTIIEPLGNKAKEKNEAFLEAYPKVLNRFTLEFIQEYCMSDGSINWPKIPEINSGTAVTKKPRKPKPRQSV
jgi:hypothetical protein